MGLNRGENTLCQLTFLDTHCAVQGVISFAVNEHGLSVLLRRDDGDVGPIDDAHYQGFLLVFVEKLSCNTHLVFHSFGPCDVPKYNVHEHVDMI